MLRLSPVRVKGGAAWEHPPFWTGGRSPYEWGNVMKVGFGDFYPPGPGGARDNLRFLFLERVRVNCPAVLRELREIVATSQRFKLTSHREALTTWSEKNGLSDSWAIDVAIETLAYWQGHAGDFWVYPNAGKGYLSPFDEEVRLSWDPTVETWTDFNRRARAALEGYRTRTKDIAKRDGFQPVPRRNLEHLDWLVSWQVKKLSRPEIADRANVTPDAVKKATKRLAKEMGLKTLRRGPQFGSGLVSVRSSYILGRSPDMVER